MNNLRAFGLLAALTVTFYWKVTLSRDYTFLDSPDLSYMVLPWYQFQARAFHRGMFPLWDPYLWCGQTLVGQMQPGAAFPLNWPLFLAPLREGHLNLDFFHWHFAWMHWLAAIFMYAYCRELQRGRFASLLAACGFSFGGFVGLTSWPQMMNGALWAPLIFLFYHRAGRERGRISAAANAACCGASIGFAILAGHHKAPLFVVLALTGVFAYELFRPPEPLPDMSLGPRARQVRLFVVIAVFAALVGAFALLPAWEHNSRAYRWVNLPSPVRMHQRVPYIAQQGQGVTPQSLLGLVTPALWPTTSPFIGLVSVSLALFGVVTCWGRRAVRVHACVALGGLAYALGSYSVFQGVLYAVIPFLDKAQSPGHAVLLFHFGLLVIAAHGADSLLAASAWRTRLASGLLCAAAVLWAAQLAHWASGSERSNRWDSLLFTAVVALLLGTIIHGASEGLGPVAVQLGAVLLLLFELHAGTAGLLLPRTNRQNPTHLDRLAQHRPVIDFLRSQERPFRFHADDGEIPYNLGDWEELETTEGYVATVTADLYDFIALDWTRSKLMLNQVYWVGRKKLRPEQVEVFSDPGGLKVFRDPGAYPRAWVVQKVRQVPGLAEGGALLNSAGFDPRRETFLVGSKAVPPAWEPCEGDSTAAVTAHQMHRVQVSVRGSCPGMLVMGDAMFPGWRARVDGSPAPLYAAYGALRGVAVPAGEHVVEMLYRPISVYLGAALTGAGLVGCLLLAIFARRESRRLGDLADPG